MGESSGEKQELRPTMPMKLYPVVLLVALWFVGLLYRGNLMVIIPLAIVPMVLVSGGEWVAIGRVTLPVIASSAYLVWVTTRADVRTYLAAFDAERT